MHESLREFEEISSIESAQENESIGEDSKESRESRKTTSSESEVDEEKYIDVRGIFEGNESSIELNNFSLKQILRHD